MFLEIRKEGRKKKFYLIHSYRLGKKIKRISLYLGSDLSKESLNKIKEKAEAKIKELTSERNLIDYELTPPEVKRYQEYDQKLEINHLQKKINWLKFTEDFTFNTNAIEGSTVTYPEVKEIIEKKKIPQNADEIETENVAQAIKFIKETKEQLSLELIKKIHFYCFRRSKSFAGELRKVEVVIRDSWGNIVHQGAPSQKVEFLLKELIHWYKQHQKKYPPLLLAAFVHNQFEKIHPFADGNGRVGRLLLNYVLLKSHYPPLNIRLKDRAKYYQMLGIFDRTANLKPTIKFFISQYKKQYK